MFFALLRRVVEVRREEVRALGWTWLYYFAVLASYYVVRPIRDEAGIAGGIDNLPWLWTGTLVAMAVANPPFAALVARLPRVRFVSWTYRFFMVNLAGFFFLLLGSSGAENIWFGRAFYVWTAVFSLFVPSVFWAFMTDLFSREQGKRLFGFISAGGTLGGIAGSLLTALLVERIPAAYLLLVSAVLIELAVLSVRRLSSLSEALRLKHELPPQERAIGGGVLSGISHAVSSPYLIGISGYMLLFTILSTFLYFQQATLIDANIADRAARTSFLARIDLLVNVLAIGVQAFVTGRMLKAVGVTLTLAFLPAMSVAGFLTLGMLPVMTVVVWFQALRRAGNFAIARPTREVLYTVLPREDRFKAKSFIDTFVYRAGDQLGAWAYALMGVLGLGIVGVSFVAIPASLAWLVIGLWLGRRQEVLAASPAARAARPHAGPVTAAPASTAR